MARHDTPLAQGGDVRTALALLTRLPVPAPATQRRAAAAWAWPLAGAAVGLLAGVAGWGALGLGLPPSLAALVALTGSALATGALHEDGLADAADALQAGSDRDRALAIMTDSRMGAYGALALILVVAARWSALADLFAEGAVFGPLLAAAVLSRAVLAAVAAALPNARGTGLSALTGRPNRRTATLAVLLGFAGALVATGATAIWLTLWAGAAGAMAAALAHRRIAGQTGDVLGAAGLLAETAALVAATA